MHVQRFGQCPDINSIDSMENCLDTVLLMIYVLLSDKEMGIWLTDNKSYITPYI